MNSSLKIILATLVVLAVSSALSVSPGDRAWAGAPGWSAIQNLTPLETTSGRDARDPAIYVDDKKVIHVVYREKEVYYLRSEDFGRTWIGPLAVSGGRRVNRAPTVLADQDGIHVIWPSLEIAPDQTHYQLFYARSENQGVTWTAPVRLTEFESSSSTPLLMHTKRGLTLIWYELDEKSLPLKEDLRPDILSQFFDNPLQGVVPREYVNLLRSTILMMQSTSGGRTWAKPNIIDEVLHSIEVFVPYQIDENTFGVYWNEERIIRNRMTRDGGLTWDWYWKLDPYLDSFFLNQIVQTPEGMELIGVPRDPFKQHRLRRLNLNTLEESFLTQPTYFRSPPKVFYGGGETHVVTSLSDEFNTWIAYMRTDQIPPRTKIVAPEDVNITSESFRIAWEAEDDFSDTVTFSHTEIYGGDQWSPFEPGRFVIVETPADGNYIFRVRAKDDAGNVEPEAAVLKFNTYGVPPNTIFDFSPPAQVYSRSVEVAWSGYDNTVINPSDLFYSYSLDDAPWTEFGKMQGQTFRQLREGKHVLRVRSQDNRGNVDSSPAEAYFDVIVGIAVAFKTPPIDGLNRPRAQYTWVGSDKTQDDVPLYYSYRLDGTAWSDWAINDTVVLDALEEGKHTFEVLAKDDIGNQMVVPLIHEFLVDLTPPDTIADLDEVIQENEYSPLISLGGTDNLAGQQELRFEYRMGDEPWKDAGKERTVALNISLTAWSPGLVVEVRAKDLVGNVDPDPAIIDLRFPGRYFRYSLGTLGVPIIYPILFVLLLLLFVLVLVGGVIFLIRRRKARKRKPVEEEEDEFGVTTAMPDAEDDLFGEDDSSISDDSSEMTFDDEDDLFS